jgi:hypothetical protein
MSRESIRDIADGEFDLTLDANAVAGPVLGEKGTAGHPEFPKSKTVFVYSRSEGLFTGAVIDDAKLMARDGVNCDLYGMTRTRKWWKSGLNHNCNHNHYERSTVAPVCIKGSSDILSCISCWQSPNRKMRDRKISSRSHGQQKRYSTRPKSLLKSLSLSSIFRSPS